MTVLQFQKSSPNENTKLNVLNRAQGHSSKTKTNPPCPNYLKQMSSFTILVNFKFWLHRCWNLFPLFTFPISHHHLSQNMSTEINIVQCDLLRATAHSAWFCSLSLSLYVLRHIGGGLWTSISRRQDASLLLVGCPSADCWLVDPYCGPWLDLCHVKSHLSPLSGVGLRRIFPQRAAV